MMTHFELQVERQIPQKAAAEEVVLLSNEMSEQYTEQCQAHGLRWS